MKIMPNISRGIFRDFSLVKYLAVFFSSQIVLSCVNVASTQIRLLVHFAITEMNLFRARPQYRFHSTDYYLQLNTMMFEYSHTNHIWLLSAYL